MKYWELREEANTKQETEKYGQEMEAALGRFARENYPDLDNEKTVIAIKNQFETDLPPDVVSDALNIPIEVARRYRYTKRRGVIDVRSGERTRISNSLRKVIKLRDHKKCVKCESDENLSIHHIIPVKYGGQTVEENLCLLCEECHLEAHCGDYSSGRINYRDLDDFWYNFAGDEDV